MEWWVMSIFSNLKIFSHCLLDFIATENLFKDLPAWGMSLFYCYIHDILLTFGSE